MMPEVKGKPSKWGRGVVPARGYEKLFAVPANDVIW